jgi:predicted nucleic acid-binding protein
LFLDTSVMIAASASARGASREIFRRAPSDNWLLVTTPYAIEEVLRHLPEFPLSASGDWVGLRSSLLVLDDIFTIELPVVFPVAKDKPILFGALAWADVLLTLDRGDFETLLGKEIYGMPILTPGLFLERERAAGRLKRAP